MAVPDNTDRALTVAAAQIENMVGDLEGNSRRIADAMAWAEEQGADVLVTPELALTGYPLADLVLRKDFVDEALEAVEGLAAKSGRTAVVLGTPGRVPPTRSWDTQERDVSIAAALLCDGEVRGFYHKVLLPNYETFEEARNFAPGDKPDHLWRIGEAVAGVSICEDLWSGDGPPEAQAAAGAQVLLVPNASPWHREKPAGRQQHASSVARRNGVPVVYLNFVGGQDELVFDGGSIVVDSEGELLYQAAQFKPERFVVEVGLPAPRELSTRPTTVHTRRRAGGALTPPPHSPEQLSGVEQAWQAIVMGTRDFTRRNGMLGAVVGLSGGIDSAVTAAVAAEALGAENVVGVAMPTEGEADGPEVSDSRALAAGLGIGFRMIDLEVALDGLGRAFAGTASGNGRPNTRDPALASRLRAAVTHALADDLGYLPLATGNKTELSIGAATLFGDMAGAFAPLRDCSKTLVYSLAEHCNRGSELIPLSIRERTPSARASDRASLPDYEVLDEVVERYVEEGSGLDDIVEATGFDEDEVRGILQLVDDAEFKRRLAPPGVKITARAFGQDRRMPIANEWRPFNREQVELVGEDTAGRLRSGDISVMDLPALDG